MNKETWMLVAGRKDYEVSDFGRVRSLPRMRNVRSRDGVLRQKECCGNPLQPLIDQDGYERVVLCNGKKDRVRVGIHQLVAQAFIGNRPDGMTINHRDGNKRNNRPDNLEYMTIAENNRHAFSIGLNRNVGEGHHASKLTDDAVQIIRQSRGEKTLRKLAEQFDVTETLISYVQTGRIWAHVHSELISPVSNMTGESNGNSRLTAEQVRDIRACQSIESSVSVAARFKVSKPTVLSIWNRKTWKEV